jgi:hypothetical protein
MWRKKKNLVPEVNLQKIKKDQEVFARAKAVSLRGTIAVITLLR